MQNMCKNTVNFDKNAENAEFNGEMKNEKKRNNEFNEPVKGPLRRNVSLGEFLGIIRILHNSLKTRGKLLISIFYVKTQLNMKNEQFLNKF